MSQSVMQALLVVGLVFVLGQYAAADPPHFYKCVGDGSTAWGSCPEGCPTIKFRIKKGAQVLCEDPVNDNYACHTGTPWAFNWKPQWGTGEGAVTGVGEFSVECSCDGGTTWETAATYTVYAKVTSVVWEKYPGNYPLGSCPNNGGKRIYPGDYSAGDPYSDDRKKVKIVATIVPAIAGETVYFKNWDVDDPSTDDSPVDSNGASGSDNRGGDGSLSPSHDTTDASGEAEVTFTVSMQPGDNFKIAASCWQAKLNSMTQAQADADDPPHCVKLSGMLTVWRKLHVDLDSMGQITGNEVTGDVNDVEHLTEVTRLTLSDFPDNFEDEDHFKRITPGYPKGRIRLTKNGNSTGWITVLDDYMSGDNGDEAIDVALDEDLSDYDGGTFELQDDDWWGTDREDIDPISLPHTLNLSVMSEAMEEAYITVTTYDSQTDSTFQVNVEDEDDAEENLYNEDENGYTEWWVVHETAAFQGTATKDCDPDDEDVQMGISDRDVWGAGDGSFTFLEAIREFVDVHYSQPEHGSPEALFSQIEGEDVAHEAGHQFSLEHSDGEYNGDTYLMAVAQQTLRDHDTYSPTSLDKIRDLDHPIND